MKQVTINETGDECQLVSSYDDLRKRDVIHMMRLAYLNPMNVAVRLGLLRQLFDAREPVWTMLEAPENHGEVWRLLQTLEWVWKGPEYRPAQKLKIRGKHYFLPDEELFQLGTAEFVIATAHLIGFHTAKTDALAVHSLASFVATIARPKPDVMERIRSRAVNGDQREAFNSLKCDRRSVMFAKTDMVTQIMIAQWFNNAANKLMTRYGMSKGDPDAAPISQGIFVQDWERQVVHVAESQVFGGYDQVMERPLTDVLAFIELKNDEIRRRMEVKKGK